MVVETPGNLLAVERYEIQSSGFPLHQYSAESVNRSVRRNYVRFSMVWNPERRSVCKKRLDHVESHLFAFGPLLRGFLRSQGRKNTSKVRKLRDAIPVVLHHAHKGSDIARVVGCRPRVDRLNFGGERADRAFLDVETKEVDLLRAEQEEFIGSEVEHLEAFQHTRHLVLVLLDGVREYDDVVDIDGRAEVQVNRVVLCGEALL